MLRGQLLEIICDHLALNASEHSARLKIIDFALRKVAQQMERIYEMKDLRYCSKCGEEYNALRHPNGHQCDPKVLAQIERDRKADEETRETEKRSK